MHLFTAFTFSLSFLYLVRGQLPKIIAIKNKPGFIELRKIEVAREIASIISHSSNRVMLDADTLLLNVSEQK